MATSPAAATSAVLSIRPGYATAITSSGEVVDHQHDEQEDTEPVAGAAAPRCHREIHDGGKYPFTTRSVE
jgi:hypothetical protein